MGVPGCFRPRTMADGTKTERISNQFDWQMHYCAPQYRYFRRSCAYPSSFRMWLIIWHLVVSQGRLNSVAEPASKMLTYIEPFGRFGRMIEPAVSRNVVTSFRIRFYSEGNRRPVVEVMTDIPASQFLQFKLWLIMMRL
jgi:hypothetical protein